MTSLLYFTVLGSQIGMHVSLIIHDSWLLYLMESHMFLHRSSVRPGPLPKMIIYQKLQWFVHTWGMCPVVGQPWYGQSYQIKSTWKTRTTILLKFHQRILPFKRSLRLFISKLKNYLLIFDQLHFLLARFFYSKLVCQFDCHIYLPVQLFSNDFKPLASKEFKRDLN